MGLLSTIGQGISSAASFLSPISNALEPLSGLLGAGASAYGQSQANESNERIAKENRDFQERMSNTSYQRAMSDMQKAGLNPMLAFRQGGASTPAGSVAQMGNVGAAGVQGYASSAQGAKTLSETRNLIPQQSALLKAEESFKRASTASVVKTIEKMSAEIVAISQGVTNAVTQNELMQLDKLLKQLSLPEQKAVAALWEMTGDYSKFLKLWEWASKNMPGSLLINVFPTSLAKNLGSLFGKGK
jgi:hypothetical protein